MEVRWEDIIKRDPPKPEFMLVERKPESYTDEEVAAIKRYEQEVANIEAERQRYRRLLNMELIKTSNDLRESIDKYNSRLEEFSSVSIQNDRLIITNNRQYLVNFAVENVCRSSNPTVKSTLREICCDPRQSCKRDQNRRNDKYACRTVTHYEIKYRRGH